MALDNLFTVFGPLRTRPPRRSLLNSRHDPGGHLVRKQRSPRPVITPFQILYFYLLGRDEVSYILSLDLIFAPIECVF